MLFQRATWRWQTPIAKELGSLDFEPFPEDFLFLQTWVGAVLAQEK
jgi:hypothetical protein